MKTKLHFLTAMGFLGLLIASCSQKKENEPRQKPEAAFSEVSPRVSVEEVSAKQDPQPVLGISLRGLNGNRATLGEPFQVAVRLMMEESEDGQIPSLVLAPVTGTWVDTIEVKLTDSTSGTVVASGLPTGSPENPTATIGGEDEMQAGGLWRFSEDATRTLSPGKYSLQGSLKIEATTAGSTGWMGAVVSTEIPLELETASNEPAQEGQRLRSQAREALLDGRNEEAARNLDASLRKNPEDLQAWILRTELCEAEGNLMGALQCLNKAHSIYESYGLREPHVELARIQSRLMAELAKPLAGNTSETTLPTWSWPPTELVRNPSELTQSMPDAPIPSLPEVKRQPESVPPQNPPTPAVEKASVPSPPTQPSAAQSASPQTSDKPEIVPWDQLNETRILQDTNGQWAISAVASSQYGATGYNADQATGAPNVPSYSDSPNAWCPSATESRLEWIELTYATAVRATEVRVRQTKIPGTIAKIEGFSTNGTAHILWEGVDSSPYPADQIVWLAVRFPETAFAVQKLKIYLNPPLKKGWKQIDAVQLVGSPPK